jgi:hypothetical protein
MVNLQMKSIVRLTGLGFLLFVGILFSCKKDGVPPTVETAIITDVTDFSAVCGGTITAEGSGTIIARGVCWGTTLNPTIKNLKTEDGDGTGSFTSIISGLYVGVAYFVRAYATNSSGATGYGITRSFIPSGQSPTATIAPATNIVSTGATLNGFVNSNSLSTIVTFEYGTNSFYGSSAPADQNPVTDNINISVSAIISGLTPGTLYHYRIIAINSVSATYSNDITFTTPAH